MRSPVEGGVGPEGGMAEPSPRVATPAAGSDDAFAAALAAALRSDSLADADYAWVPNPAIADDLLQGAGV